MLSFTLAITKFCKAPEISSNFYTEPPPSLQTMDKKQRLSKYNSFQLFKALDSLKSFSGDELDKL